MADKKITGLLIDVTRTGTAEVIEFTDNLETIYKLLDVDLIDVASRNVGGKYYDFIVDDEGDWKERVIPSVLDRKEQPMLVGNVLVVNSEGGEFTSLTQGDIFNLLHHIGIIHFTEKDEKKSAWVLAGVDY